MGTAYYIINSQYTSYYNILRCILSKRHWVVGIIICWPDVHRHHNIALCARYFIIIDEYCIGLPCNTKSGHFPFVLIDNKVFCTIGAAVLL